MKKTLVVLALFCAFSAVSCGSGDSQKNTGGLNEPCYPNKTCNEGFVCEDEKNICVEDHTNQADDSDTLPEQTESDADNDADTIPEQNDADADTDSADDADTLPDEDADTEPGRKQGELYGECYPDETCNPGLTCDVENNICIRDNNSPDDDSDTAPDDDDPTDDKDDTDPIPDEDPSGCAYDNLGNTCTTDKQCGSCMICASAKCVRGCTSNNDCEAVLPNSGLKCNKKLARCVNIYGSNQACSETNCPIGCCYAKKGLSGLRCETNPNISTCGVCAQGKIYSPEDGGTCVPAVCSSIDDNCPSINAGSTKPSCYVCKTAELICAKNNTSGCSSATVVNTAECIPTGQMCIEGLDNCCSGNPCVNGYCY